MSGPRSFQTSSSRLSVLVLTFTLVLVTITASCGSSSSAPNSPKLSGNTSVTVLLSSTANDQLSQFSMELQSLTLTSQSGKTVNVFTTQQPSEFVHINGNIEPLVTVSIPQDVYTAATATIGGAQFTCIMVIPPGYSSAGNLDTSTYAYGYTPNSNVTVTLPSAITVTGSSMTMGLDLLVSQSASYASCYPSISYAITPTFNLTAMTLSANPTNPQNGKTIGMVGEITALGSSAGNFTLSVNMGGTSVRTFSVTANSATVYQGINDSSALQIGTFVDMDAAIQTDGSLLATRIAVYDSAALNVMIGPLVFSAASEPNFYTYGRQQQGQDYSKIGSTLGVYSFAGTTAFEISSQLSNLSALPFTPVFGSSNMVPGQNIAVYSQQLSAFYGGQTTTATTMTLMPQSITGTVISSSSAGNGFTDYTVQLASWDLFADLAVQPGQATLISNPNLVDVYVDKNAQLLNTVALSSGNTLRFYGLVFNDNGTLRMDCAQVNDGANGTSQSNSDSQLSGGQTVRSSAPAARAVSTRISSYR